MAEILVTGRRGKIKQDFDVYKGSVDVAITEAAVENTQAVVFDPKYVEVPDVLLGNHSMALSGGSATDHVVSIEISVVATKTGFTARAVLDAAPGAGETTTVTIPFEVKGIAANS